MNKREVTVLLVDDNIVDVQGVKRAFKKARILNPIRVAEDGLAATEIRQDPS